MTSRAKVALTPKVEPDKPPEGSLVMAYSTILALVPVLALYGPRGLPINLGEVGMVVFGIAATERLLRGGRSVPALLGPWRPLPLVTALMLIGVTCMAVLVVDGPASLPDVLFRSAKVLLWGFSVSVTSYVLLNIDRLTSVMKIVTWCACLYLIFQTVAWNVFDVFTPSVMDNSFFPPMQEGYLDEAYLIAHYELFYLRPASFFGEPAYFSYYAIVLFVLVLFRQHHRSRNDWALLSVMTLCVALSTSTTGLYMTAIVWVVWVVRRAVVSERAGGLFTTGAYFGLLVATLMLIAGNAGDLRFLQTLQHVSAKPLGWASSGRLGGSYELFDELDGLQRLIGVGFGNEEVYLRLGGVFYNDVTAILLGAGYLGLLIFVLYAALLVLQAGRDVRLLALIYVAICLAEQHMYSAVSFVSLSVVLYGTRAQWLGHRRQQSPLKEPVPKGW